MSFTPWKTKKLHEQYLKSMGSRLRHLAGINETSARNEALEIIKQLGNEPSVINSQGAFYYSPIFKAVRRSNHEVSKALMNAPALNVNIRDVYGFNILMFALREIYPPDHELIQYLLTRADLDFTTKSHKDKFGNSMRWTPRVADQWRGASALFLATERAELFQYIPALLDRVEDEVNDYVECVESERPEGTVNSVRSAGCDGLYYEQRSPLTNLVKAFDHSKEDQRDMLLNCIKRIANAPSEEHHNRFGMRPKDEALFLAAQAGNKPITEILLAAGANTQLKNDRDKTAYDVARYAGNQTVADCIHDYSANQNQVKVLR